MLLNINDFTKKCILFFSDKIVKGYNAKVKAWVYFKVFHEEFKSLDYNVVKRKLPDVRKTLEISGGVCSSPSKSSPHKMTKVKTKTKPITEANEGESIYDSKMEYMVPNSTNASAPYSSPKQSRLAGQFEKTSINILPQVVMRNCSSFAYSNSQQTPPHLTSSSNNNNNNNNESTCVASNASLIQPCVYQVCKPLNDFQQQQPIDLQLFPCNNIAQQPQQLVKAVPLNRQQNTIQQFKPLQTQPVSINLANNGQAYYLSLGNLPNIITVPPSSCATVLSVTANKGAYATNNILHTNSAVLTATLLSPSQTHVAACNNSLVKSPIVNLSHHAETITYLAANNSEVNAFTNVVPMSTVEFAPRRITVAPAKHQGSICLPCDDGNCVVGLPAASSADGASISNVYRSSSNQVVITETGCSTADSSTFSAAPSSSSDYSPPPHFLFQ